MSEDTTKGGAGKGPIAGGFYCQNCSIEPTLVRGTICDKCRKLLKEIADKERSKGDPKRDA